MFTCDISNLTYHEAQTQLRGAIINPDSISCQIDFDANYENSKIIRDFVGQVFDIHTIGYPWKGRFILITDELINNAIEHGSQPGEIDTCIITAGKDEQGGFSIALEVQDTGNGKDSKNIQELKRKKEERRIQTDDTVYMEKRGRGLFHITEKIVDKLSFSKSPKGGLTVKIEKYLPKTHITQ